VSVSRNKFSVSGILFTSWSGKPLRGRYLYCLFGIVRVNCDRQCGASLLPLRLYLKSLSAQSYKQKKIFVCSNCCMLVPCDFREGITSLPFFCGSRGWLKDYPRFHLRLRDCNQSAKYDFSSSNTTRTTLTLDACFVWKLAPLADERSVFFIENLSRRLTRSSTYLTLQTRTWPTDGDNHLLRLHYSLRFCKMLVF
jgi:hypothetical protein